MPMLSFLAWPPEHNEFTQKCFSATESDLVQTQNDFTLPIPQSTDNSQNQIK